MRGFSLFLIFFFFSALLLFGAGAAWMLYKSDTNTVEQEHGFAVRKIPPDQSASLPGAIPLAGETAASTTTRSLDNGGTEREIFANPVEAIGKAWGLVLHDRTGKSPALDPSLQSLAANDRLHHLAKALDLALVGDISGKVADIYLTPHAVYAGSNEDVVRLLEALSASDEEERADAVDDLADISDDENLELVIARMLARDVSEEVRAVAAMGLENAEAPGTIDLLVNSLYDPSLDVREHARTTLGVIGTNDIRLRLKQERLAAPPGDTRDIIDQILEESFGEEVTLDDE